MTNKTAVLLIIKQYNGIRLADLFNKTAGNYSNSNSARAALSRVIKDLTALGLIKRVGNMIYLTDKGLLEISKEVKNKLLLKLNATILGSNLENIDEIVAKLSTLIERGKQDADLLKVAKESTDFSISDLNAMHGELSKRVSHLNYIEGIFSNQIASLCELDFKEIMDLQWNKENIEMISVFASEEKVNELMIEATPEFLPVIQHNVGGERKKDHLFIEAQKFGQLLSFLMAELQKEHDYIIRVSVMFSNITVELNKQIINIAGPYSKISKLMGKGKKIETK